MPLQPVLQEFPFSKWGLEFIGPINPPSSAGKVFILTTTKYFMKWTEVVPHKNSQDEQVISFLETNIFSRFVLPLEIITDNGLTFISAKLTQILAKLGLNTSPHQLIIPKEMGRPSLPTRIWWESSKGSSKISLVNGTLSSLTPFGRIKLPQRWALVALLSSLFMVKKPLFLLSWNFPP